MSRFLLVRHAASDWAGDRIAGRLGGIHLAAAGRQQAQQLADSLAAEKISAIFSSPRERAYETAQFLAAAPGKQINVAAELDEIAYGDWTGESFARLGELPRWRAFNSMRSCTRIPGGELIVEVQARIVGLMDRLRELPAKGVIVLVSHADVIRTALAYYLSVPLDFMLRLEISPASVSMIAIDAEGPKILCVNQKARVEQ
jgi:probable phosphoglycerate mutase